MIHANPQSVLGNFLARKSGDGFTLLELLVALAIVAILLTLAAPSFTTTIANHRVKSAASDIHMALLKARSEATSHNASVTITPNSGDWKEGWVVRRGGVTIDNHDPLKGVTISDPGTVTYRSSGRVLGGVAFTVTSETVSTTQRCVSVDLSGRPYVKEGACS